MLYIHMVQNSKYKGEYMVESLFPTPSEVNWQSSQECEPGAWVQVLALPLIHCVISS